MLGGIGFESLTESIDTTTSGGKLIFYIFGALAEFEREVIKECTLAGPQAPKKLAPQPVELQEIQRWRIILNEDFQRYKNIHRNTCASGMLPE